MTDREERFAEALDALTRGDPRPNDDDLARFAAEARGTWSSEATGPPPGTPPRLSAAERRHLWESIRQETVVSRSRDEGSPIMTGASLTAPGRTSRPTGWGALVARWQPVLSVAVMFALLIGLVGVAYTGLNRRDNTPSPAAGLIAQSTPMVGVECTPYGPPALTRDEIKGMSWSDWPRRQYIPVAPVDPEIGQAIVDVYENWYACSLMWSNDDNALLAAADGWNFNSERKQYQMHFSTYPEQRQDEIEDWNQFDPNWVIQSGALPLNRPVQTTTELVTGLSFDTFAPGDVYLLSDGRYGVVLGRISTIMLAASQPESNLIPDPDHRSTWLTFIAFENSGGYYLVDEIQSFCVVPFAAQQGGSVSGEDLCDA